MNHWLGCKLYLSPKSCTKLFMNTGCLLSLDCIPTAYIDDKNLLLVIGEKEASWLAHSLDLLWRWLDLWRKISQRLDSSPFPTYIIDLTWKAKEIRVMKPGTTLAVNCNFCPEWIWFAMIISIQNVYIFEILRFLELTIEEKQAPSSVPDCLLYWGLANDQGRSCVQW